ncbi:MAG: glycoside hydrolase domain-containing protein, partial [Brevundimonas sp.]
MSLESSQYAPSTKITGKKFGPGSLLGSVAAVTASGENPPGEVVANLADAASSTKWLVRTTTAWAQYQLSAEKTVKVYSLTSANDDATRDPKSWNLQGSADGQSWTTIDTQTGQTFASRFQTQSYTVATPGSYLYYRLNITQNNGSTSITQLGDWEILDGTTDVGDPTPLITKVGSGPISGPTIKASVGFTGTKALQYVGAQTDAGDASASNVLYSDLDLPITAGTELAYKVFPVLETNDLTYPATFVAVDLELSDGTTTSLMSDAGLTDQYGFGADAASQGAQKALYGSQWNSVRVDLSSLAGKTVKKVLLSYHRPDGKPGAFSGWLDDIAIRPAAVVDGSSLVNWVDTRRGTNANSSFSRGNNIPATALPNGFNFYTPMTDANSSSWLYNYASANNSANRPTLNGIGISHEPSPWMGDRNQLAIMPSLSTAAAPDANLTNRAMAFSHDNEIARPDLYQVAFDNGTIVKVAPADHSAVYSFTFPETANVGSVIVDQVGTTANASKFTATGNTVTGWVEQGSGLSAGRTRMYFTAEFSQTPTTSIKTTGRTTGLGVKFDTSATKTVEMRIATSFISTAQAKANLDEEVTGKSFSDVQATATAKWNDRLSVLKAPNATPAQNTELYGNLYRLNLYPNSQFEHTGKGSAGG